MLKRYFCRSHLILPVLQESLRHSSLPDLHRTGHNLLLRYLSKSNIMDEDFVDRAEELDFNERDGRLSGRGVRGGRGRGGRGGRGGGRGGGQMNRQVAISKALSKLLRHAAEEAGLKLDAEGFAPLDQVVSPHCQLRMRGRAPITPPFIASRPCHVQCQILLL